MAAAGPPCPSPSWTRLPAVKRLLIAVAGCATLLAATTPADAKDFERCADTNIGFTEANVRAENISCRKARRFIYRWARTDYNCTPENGYCRVTRRKGFRCVKGGSELTVRLRCRREDQTIRASWGD
jgi:hypothetical protein